MVSGTRCPYVSVCECDGERGSGPEGADDLCCCYCVIYVCYEAGVDLIGLTLYMYELILKHCPVFYLPQFMQ